MSTTKGVVMEIILEPMLVSDIMRKILAPHGKRERDSGEFVGPYNQDQVAKILGITQSMVSDWKRSGIDSDNQRNWQNWLRLFTYCEQELGFDPRYPLSKKLLDDPIVIEIRDILRKSRERGGDITVDDVDALIAKVNGQSRKKGQVRSVSHRKTKRG